MNIVISIGLFITVVLLLEGLFYFYRSSLSPEARRIQQRVRRGEIRATVTKDIKILRSRNLSGVASFRKVLESSAQINFIERLLRQADSQLSVGVFLLLSALLGISGIMVFNFFSIYLLAAVGVGVLMACMPLVMLLRQRKKRFALFERQLPDALDLISRALRAGHSLSVGMNMIGEELAAPIGSEFERTVQEISFGVPTQEALGNLCTRIDSLELKFFVTALLVQWETGGNLIEILETISDLIRQRFELLSKVRSLSAEGRLSAIILFGMPIVLAGVISLVNPDYIIIMTEDPIGQGMLACGAFLMILGGIITKRMVNIDV